MATPDRTDPTELPPQRPQRNHHLAKQPVAAWTAGGLGKGLRSPPGPSPPAPIWCLPHSGPQPSCRCLPPLAGLLWPAPQARLHRPPASPMPLAGPVYGLSNEPEVQTAPGGSSWAGAPAWGMAPQVPGTHYAPSLGPFTSCLFAGWVPDAQAGPGGCAGLQVGSRPGQPAVVQSRRMKGDLVLYDSLVWLMGSLEGLPARGPEPLSRGLALRQDQDTQRLCGAPALTPQQTQSPIPDQLIGAPLRACLPLPPRVFSPRGTRWPSRVKPVPPSLSWLTAEPLDCFQSPLLTSATPHSSCPLQSLAPHRWESLSLPHPPWASPDRPSSSPLSIPLGLILSRPTRPAGHRANRSLPSAPLFLWSSTVTQTPSFPARD